VSSVPEIAVEIAGNPGYLRGVRDCLKHVVQEIGFRDDQVSMLVLAVDEALVNVIKHGYGGSTDGRIWLSIEKISDARSGPGVRIVIEDRAVQVDPSRIKSRELSDIRPGGLGVHIIRRVTDDAKYEQRDGGGMRLTLTKFLASPPVGPEPG
jgi:anti-sigma regulatory factor (Ser/Thr protein kinase)